MHFRSCTAQSIHHLMYVIQQSSRCRTPGDALCLEDAAVFAAYILEVMQCSRMTHIAEFYIGHEGTVLRHQA